MIRADATTGQWQLPAGLKMRSNVTVDMAADTVLKAYANDKPYHDIFNFYEVENAHIRGGTLIGHYRHHAVHNPFEHVGLTDLTCHVNFTAIAEAACQAGLDLIGYTTQAAFLLNLGLTDLLAAQGEPESQAHIRAAIPAPQGAEAIGWLYCAEGSNLGAAFLMTDAQNKLRHNESPGARHLAPHMDGRGKHWRAFVSQFNQLPLNAEEQETALKGALEAFAFYKVLLREIFEVA